MRHWLAFLGFAATLCLTTTASATRPTATFALIIGVNQAADRELPKLRYADDDAARYQDLFRVLGMRTHLLARIDKNTRRVHAQAAAEASLPTRRSLERAVSRLAAEIRRAKRRKIRTLFYLVYAGHGNVKRGEAYLLLEDHRLTGKRIAKLVTRLGADQSHLIVDACHSGLLVMSRGPGGTRRRLEGFSRIGAALSDRRIGLLLSSSSGRESHEWENFQAGVFSHEVRSGLYGAADADGDGRISYREIAAFIERANAAIPNERYRPDVYARPPADSGMLADVRRALARRVEVKTKTGAHYALENGLGVRLADLHPGTGHKMNIIRPGVGKLYLRQIKGREEYGLPGNQAVIRLADLQPEQPRVAMRGAAHEAFGRVFALPFDEEAVRRFRFRPLIPRSTPIDTPPPSQTTWRHPAGIVALGVGAAAATTGLAFTLSAERLHADGSSGGSQAEVAARNDRVAGRQLAAAVSFGVAGAAAAAGLTLLLWPDESGAGLSATASPSSVSIGFGSRWDPF